MSAHFFLMNSRNEQTAAQVNENHVLNPLNSKNLLKYLKKISEYLKSQLKLLHAQDYLFLLQFARYKRETLKLCQDS